MESYAVRVVGRLLSADLDGEGRIHIVVGKDDPEWTATAVKMLRLYSGKLIVLGVRAWLPKPLQKRGLRHVAIRRNRKEV